MVKKSLTIVLLIVGILLSACGQVEPIQPTIHKIAVNLNNYFHFSAQDGAGGEVSCKVISVNPPVLSCTGPKANTNQIEGVSCQSSNGQWALYTNGTDCKNTWLWADENMPDSTTHQLLLTSLGVVLNFGPANQ